MPENETSAAGCAVALVLWLACAASHAQQASPEPSPPRDGAERAPAAARPTRAEISKALRAYSHEPGIDRVVQIALDTAANDPQRARDLASRARNAGWVPTFRLALRRGLTRDLSESQTLDADRTSLSTDDDLVVEASLTFDLHRLVFDRNEVALAREERELERDRAELVRTVIHLYYERRRLQLERDLSRTSDVQREIRIDELEALLNGFTDGAFRRMIAGGK
jgi:hypothetical protein